MHAWTFFPGLDGTPLPPPLAQKVSCARQLLKHKCTIKINSPWDSQLGPSLGRHRQEMDRLPQMHTVADRSKEKCLELDCKAHNAAISYVHVYGRCNHGVILTKIRFQRRCRHDSLLELLLVSRFPSHFPPCIFGRALQLREVMTGWLIYKNYP